jgi:hypothetical protein
MAGPYPPHQGTGASGPYTPPPAYSPDYPFEAGPAAAAYPGPLPPPVPYPKRRRGRVIAIVVVTLAVIAGVVAAVVFAVRDHTATQAGVLNSAGAQRAIQGYLDALSHDDLQAISRNMLCGLYDGVKDRRADDALAKLSAEAFQKQFSGAEVTSVDTMVFSSPNSAQVLFTMRVTSAIRGGGAVERQGVAQLLSYDNEILVGSYVLRTAGVF